MCEYKDKSYLIKNTFLLVAETYQVVLVLGDSGLTRSLAELTSLCHSFISTRRDWTVGPINIFRVSSNSNMVILWKIFRVVETHLRISQFKQHKITKLLGKIEMLHQNDLLILKPVPQILSLHKYPSVSEEFSWNENFWVSLGSVVEICSTVF